MDKRDFDEDDWWVQWWIETLDADIILLKLSATPSVGLNKLTSLIKMNAKKTNEWNI